MRDQRRVIVWDYDLQESEEFCGTALEVASVLGVDGALVVYSPNGKDVFAAGAWGRVTERDSK